MGNADNIRYRLEAAFQLGSTKTWTRTSTLSGITMDSLTRTARDRTARWLRSVHSREFESRAALDDVS
jgi:hypothetical protein